MSEGSTPVQPSTPSNEHEVNTKGFQNPFDVIPFDPIGLIGALWKGKNIILAFMAFFLVWGFISYKAQTKMYSTTTRLLPEYNVGGGSSSGSSLLRQYGGLLGFEASSWNKNSSALGVQYYPELAESDPFLVKLIAEPIYFQSLDTAITYYDYIKHYQKPNSFAKVKNGITGAPSALINGVLSIFKSDEENSSTKDLSKSQAPKILFTTQDSLNIGRSIKERINVSFDDESGMVEILTTMPDKAAAVQLAEATKKVLTNEISAYYTQKIRTDLDFIQKKHDESKAEYEAKKAELADWYNRNSSVTDPKLQLEREYLQDKVTFIGTIYSSFASQLEERKIKLQEATPIFRTLDPPVLPKYHSTPIRNKILGIYVFIGLFVSILFVAVRHLWAVYGKLLKEMAEEAKTSF